MKRYRQSFGDSMLRMINKAMMPQMSVKGSIAMSIMLDGLDKVW